MGSEVCHEILRRTGCVEHFARRTILLVVTQSGGWCYLASRPFDVMREYRTANRACAGDGGGDPGGNAATNMRY